MLKLISQFLLIILSAPGVSAESTAAQDLSSMPSYNIIITDAHMTNVTSGEIFSFLDQTKTIQVMKEQQFSKLEIIFKKKARIDHISIETCGEEFKDGLDLYVNYNEEFKFLEGGKKTLRFAVGLDSVEAIAINFRRNVLFCLKKISFEYAGRALPIEVPHLFEAQVTGGAASESLFDSQVNTGARWATPPMSIDIKAKSLLEFDQILIWPGDFTNDLIFTNYSRPKNIEVTCDQDSAELFELKDQMIMQSLKLSKTLSCRNVKLKSISDYAGREKKDLVVSELRFSKDDQIFFPDMSDIEKSRRNKIAGEFENAGLSKILERQLLSVETPQPSMFRLHADGSFFIRGFDELAKENSLFYILGSMTAKAVKQDRIRLSLRGIKKSNRLEMDSLSCGRKCFGENDFSSEKDFFEEEVLIRKGKDGFYRIDTITPSKKRRVDFTSVRFLLDHTL